MRKTMIALAAVCFLTTFAFVPAGFSQQQEKGKSKATKEHSMTGCLEPGTGENNFQLTHVEGGKVPLVEIPETTVNLTPHIGHKVQITGTAIQGKEGVHTMKVTAVKMISATCP
jgi:hypothetical protein